MIILRGKHIMIQGIRGTHPVVFLRHGGYPKPAGLSARNSADIRFGGPKDVLKKNGFPVYPAVSETALEKLRREALENPILEAGGKKLTGLELLQIAYEISRFTVDSDQAKMVAGAMMLGVPFLFSKFRNTVNYRKDAIFDRSRVTEIIFGVQLLTNPFTPLEDKVREAFFKLEDLGFALYLPDTFKTWRIEDPGYLALNRYGAILKNPDYKKHVALSGIGYRLYHLKVLMTPDQDGVNGWDLLRQIDKVINEDRNAVLRYMNPGLDEKTLLKRLRTRDGETTKNQMNALMAMGLIERTVPQLKPSRCLDFEKLPWSLTESGKAFLKNGDPLSFGLLTHQDIKDVLQLEIDRLKKAQAGMDQTLKEIESVHQTALEAHSKRKELLTQTEAKALEYYAEFKANVNPSRQDGLEKAVMEKTMEAEYLQALLKIETEALQQMTFQVQGAKTDYINRTKQTHQLIKNLLVAQSRLNKASLEDKVISLASEVDPATGKENADHENLKTLLASLNVNFELTPLPEQPTQGPSIAIKPNQSAEGAILEERIRAIQATRILRPKPKSPVPLLPKAPEEKKP